MGKKKKSRGAIVAPLRKQDAATNKREEVTRPTDLKSLLSEELQRELGMDYNAEGTFDPNALILDPSLTPKMAVEEAPTETKLSKKKQKKLDMLRLKKEKAVMRAQLYASLNSNALSKEQQALLKSTKTLGQEATLKQKLRKALAGERAGVDLNVDVPLFKYSTRHEEDEEDEEDEADEADGNAAPESHAKQQQRTKTDSQSTVPVTVTPLSQNDVTAIAGSDNTLSAQEKKRLKRQRLKQKKRKAAVAELHSSDNDGTDMSDSSQPKPTEQDPKRQRLTTVEPSAPPAAIPVATSDPKPLPLTGFRGRRAVYVEVCRKPEIQESRMKLPCAMMEHEVMEAIQENLIVIICGETGSGKSTQVPQFLYEAGYGFKVGKVNASSFVNLPQNLHIGSLPNQPALTTNRIPVDEIESLNLECAFETGMVGVTQPRRVAAVSLAKRVAEELNVTFGKEVGYQVRYDAAHVCPETKIKFMTDGILLREIQADFLLRKYSIVILDEAHERNMNTDILIGLLSRIIPLRAQLAHEDRQKREGLVAAHKPLPASPALAPLKMVIMSATLRVEDFVANSVLFPHPPPVIKVEARQHPVTIHFARQTAPDYVEEAFHKVCKIHTKLPPGGILVFATGQREIDILCKRIRKQFDPRRLALKKQIRADLKRNANRPGADQEAALRKERANTAVAAPSSLSDADQKLDQLTSTADEDYQDWDWRKPAEEVVDEGMGVAEPIQEEADLEAELEAEVLMEDADAVEEHGVKQDEEDVIDVGDEEQQEEHLGPVLVLPLYSMLPAHEQLKVFAEPPEGTRLIIIATNVAETSLTIPNIRYVVDGGKEKRRIFDKRTGMSRFDIEWISKASANQRAGRAGRTGPGHCYRLYSSAVFNDQFDQFSAPEILQTPVEGMVLQMKAMGIDEVTSFPFPTPPERQSLATATKQLQNLSILDSIGKITSLGKIVSAFPLAPRYAKMLALGRQGGCLPYAIALVAALTVEDLFIREISKNGEDSDDEAGSDTEKNRTGSLSDAAKRQRFDKTVEERDREARHQRQIAAFRAHAQWVDSRSDLLSALRVIGAFIHEGQTDAFCAEHFLHLKNIRECIELMKQLTRIVNQMSGSAEKLNGDLRMPPPTPSQQKLLLQIISAGFVDRVAWKEANAVNELGKSNLKSYQAIDIDEPVYIHPTSNLFREIPEVCVYREVVETSKPYMKMVTSIKPSWLAKLDTPLCSFSKPLSFPAPTYQPDKDVMMCYVTPTYGPKLWELPVQKMEFPECSEKYKWFARFLLDGDVCPPLQEFVPFLTGKPAAVTRTWAQAKIASLVRPLELNRIASRQQLLDKWAVDKQFLLEPYLFWVQQNAHQRLKSIWPPVQTLAPGSVAGSASKPSASRGVKRSRVDEEEEEEGEERGRGNALLYSSSEDSDSS